MTEILHQSCDPWLWDESFRKRFMVFRDNQFRDAGM